MVSELILDLNMGVYSVWSRGGYLSVWPCNPIRYNEDVVSALDTTRMYLSHPTSDMAETL